MKSIKCIVTTGHKYNAAVVQTAKQKAAELNLLFISRENLSIESIRATYQTEFVLVVKKTGLVLATPEGDFFFHPNMAQLRLKNLLKGQKDNMIEAMQLKSGMEVLDCTLGMASDAIIASFVVGVKGRVVGLEAKALMAAVVQDGLKNFSTLEPLGLQAAMRRIEVIQQEYGNYLKLLPDKSFDVVYFDPMFRHPIKESLHLLPLRALADHRAITIEAINEARRVARQCVIIKENSRSLEFVRLGADRVVGGKYSHVHYGIIDIKTNL